MDMYLGNVPVSIGSVSEVHNEAQGLVGIAFVRLRVRVRVS